MKKLLLITGLFYTILVSSQIDSGLLFGLTNATTAEMNAITGMAIGQMLYNTDTHEIFTYDGTNWVMIVQWKSGPTT